MSMSMRSCLIVLLLCAANATTSRAAPDAPEPDPAAPEKAPQATPEQLERIRLALPPDLDARSSRAELWSELLRTAVESARLREELARSQADLSIIRKELEELRQFILDHEEFGSDYEEYQRIKKVAERETRRRQAEQRRKEVDAQREEQRKGRNAQQQQRSREELAKIRAEQYQQAGFTPIGLEAFMGRSSYFYAPEDSTQPPMIYKPYRIGTAYTSPSTGNEIDYTKMTISGSVLSAAADIRNIGVAITFFDEHNNQIGAEIVQIENARPNVPYPFTAQLQMALNRPFASHASYVLYSDPVP
ncbi:MAG: hypothetical protein CMJ24_11390 [Phycisphaerae bacterium]|nr:hypothetical protein [Phycisphaerae bacterium]